MDKLVVSIKKLLYPALVCYLAGFIMAAFSPNTVFFGIGLIIIGTVLVLTALFPVVKLIKLHKKNKS